MRIRNSNTFESDSYKIDFHVTKMKSQIWISLHIYCKDSHDKFIYTYGGKKRILSLYHDNYLVKVKTCSSWKEAKLIIITKLLNYDDR